MKKKILYLLSPDLKWGIFNRLQYQLVHDSGPVCVELPRVLWELLRKKQIILWFAEDMKNDMGVGLEIPKRYKKWEIRMITNGKKPLPKTPTNKKN